MTFDYNDPVMRQILEQRARDLARPLGENQTAEGEEEVVFEVGGARYGLPARAVVGVQPFGRYTPLPQTPAWILGLVNVRGKLLTAIDIRSLLDLPQTVPTVESALVLITANGVEVGVLADRVVEVRRGNDELSPALSVVAGRPTAWLRGIDKTFTLLLDPASLLADQRLMINDTN